jgi:hypothetical protein
MIAQVGFPRDRAETGPPISLGPPPIFELAPQSVPARSESATRPAELAPHLDEPVFVALRQLLQNHPERAVEALRAYDPGTQELLMGLLPITAYLTERGLHPTDSQEVAHLLDQVGELETTLRSRAPLALTSLCFCRDIRGFGNYQPLQADHVFRAGVNGGRGERAYVYGELHNPTIRRQGEFYETCLRARLVVRDAADKVVWEGPPEDVGRRFLHTLPHDFFIMGHFEVPERIAPGGYTLTIHLEDLLAQPVRSTRQSLDFQVGADSSSPLPVRMQ